MSVTPQVRVNAQIPRPDGSENYSFFALNATGIPLTLASAVGVTSIEWSIVSKPTGATTTIASATPAAPFSTSFGPLDVRGTYILKCVVNGDADSVKEFAVAVRTTNRFMRVPARAESGQWSETAWWEDALADLFDEVDGGSFVYGLSSGDTKAYSLCRSKATSTADATPTAIDTFTPPADCAITVSASIDAMQSDSTDSWGCTVKRRFNVVAGVVTAVAAATLDAEGTAGSAGMTADIDTSGGAIRLMFTGIAAQTWRVGSEFGVSIRTLEA